MALRKIIQVEGEAFLKSADNVVSLGAQKTAFSAYCKIVNITGDKERGRVTVECKADQYKINKQYSVEFSTSDDAPNFIKQAYIQLKKMPEWADATDC